jgi:hypothetical protein
LARSLAFDVDDRDVDCQQNIDVRCSNHRPLLAKYQLREKFAKIGPQVNAAAGLICHRSVVDVFSMQENSLFS